MAIVVGGTFTLLGTNFGASGRIRLRPSGETFDNLQVDEWSDTAVTFTVQESWDELPFGAHGALTLLRDGGGDDGMHVNIVPLSDVFFSEDSWSESGTSVFGFTEEKTLESAGLPDSFRLVDVPFEADVSRGCVALGGLIETFLLPHDFAEITSEPFVDQSSNEIRCNVEVDLDAPHWDFDLTAQFFIEVPRGIPAPGWEAA